MGHTPEFKMRSASRCASSSGKLKMYRACCRVAAISGESRMNVRASTTPGCGVASPRLCFCRNVASLPENDVRNLCSYPTKMDDGSRRLVPRGTLLGSTSRPSSQAIARSFAPRELSFHAMRNAAARLITASSSSEGRPRLRFCRRSRRVGDALVNCPRSL
jgi:hypothetical protein